MTLKSLEHQNRLALEFYRIDLYSAVENIYRRLCEDKQFRSWMVCPHNSSEDLFYQFMLIVEDEVLGTIDFSKGTDGFIVYNMLVEDSIYSKWTHELFDIVRLNIKTKYIRNESKTCS